MTETPLTAQEIEEARPVAESVIARMLARCQAARNSGERFRLRDWLTVDSTDAEQE